ncbi:MAG: hypothetical protein IOD12_13425 [Silvanigrellales bacterium]|nr:hypothetical protein [Silvanigrellales bacterium]
MLSLLNNELAEFPTKSQLDDFEVGGLREQESYDLALTALITIATGIPDIFARREHHEDDFSLVPEGVRSQLITIFKEKVSDARAAFMRGR